MQKTSGESKAGKLGGLGSAPLDVQTVREDIFVGRGYHIVRGFLQPEEALHIIQAWSQGHNQLEPKFNKHQHIFEGCPDYSVVSPDLARHYNFFWNRPLDKFTYTTAWRMQTMRNELEGVPASHEFLPMTRGLDDEYRAASYRIIFTKQGGPVGTHVDYAFDHSRVQMSLNLSIFGQDYDDGGFLFYDQFRGGEPFNLGERENLQPGDLVMFRYGQKHGVEAVQTSPGQRGFCRILMPQEIIPLGGSRNPILRRIQKRIEKQKKKSKGIAKPKAESEALYYDAELVPLMKEAVQQGFGPAEVYHPGSLWVDSSKRAEAQAALQSKQGVKTER